MSISQASRKPSARPILAAPWDCKGRHLWVLCCLVWVLCFHQPHLNYVGKAVQVRSSRRTPLRTTMRVREGRGTLLRKNVGSKTPKGGKSRDSSLTSGGDKAARILTAKIKQAPTAADLLGVLNDAVDSPDFNYFHVSAAYHSLAMFHRKGLLQGLCDSPVLPKLHVRVEAMITSKQINPQASANVLWAMAVLFAAVPRTTRLLPALIKVFPEKAPGMHCPTPCGHQHS
ncbi:Uncharacterized protein SCF082_LOCUS11824 [Durusdinium trenchii]|uniref:Uncharacterized protein n=1 Tax=Durusdinium trenchii TaxID=1381693 RepID=A0ABP0JFM2_9DINO